jgi:hypothetical protein
VIGGLALLAGTVVLVVSLSWQREYVARAVVAMTYVSVDLASARGTGATAGPVVANSPFPDLVTRSQPGAESSIIESGLRRVRGARSGGRPRVDLRTLPVGSEDAPVSARQNRTLSVTVFAAGAGQAAAAANAVATAYAEYRRDVVARAVAQEQEQLALERAAVGRRTPRAVALLARRRALGTVLALEANNVYIAKRAQRSAEMKSPHPLRNALVAALLGALLGEGVLAWLSRQRRPSRRDPPEAWSQPVASL